MKISSTFYTFNNVRLQSNVLEENKEKHWLQVSTAKLLGYYSGNIKIRNVSYC